MGDFIRYQSIENHYQEKYIWRWLEQFPELQQTEFVLTEKLDGANIQVLITHDEIKIGKRSGWIDGNFYDIDSILHEYYPRFRDIQARIVDTETKSIRLYGELYGEGVQKRIDYGKKQIKFFDAMIDDTFVPYCRLCDILIAAHLSAPRVVAFVTGLTNVVEYDNEFQSENATGLAEGFVARPLTEVFYNKNGQRLLIKSKTKEFAEKMYLRNTKKKQPVNLDDLKYYTTFCSYINKDRVLWVFSQHGEIQRPQDMGYYIKLVLADAKEDFLKDTTLPENVDQKKVFNAGHLIAPILKEFL